ncbi:hypothetical protein QP585_14690 [Serratia ureilytica]|uniref:hypothetical protein n=1 Tax=Serratia ureilytica TaxID=300181 RepID=UPI00254D50AD|nr:hypothetical protein [Serratia ureilytica]MDK7594359.1 hypothetical protein [Serratia ureilytica]
MTLTTERLKDLTFHRSKLIFPASHEEAAAMARELLANREAQPVALVDRRPAASGGVCWKNGGKDLPHGTELFTAPPAPAVPDEATAENVEELSGYVSTYKMTDSERDIAAEVWNACRAAMLAQPVSQRYTLPPHVYRELVNSLRDTAETYQGTQQLRAQLSRTLTENGLVAAAPEGGNDHDTGR